MASLRDALSDVAETIRRAFRDPPCLGVPLPLGPPGLGAVAPVEARSQAPDYAFRPCCRTEPPLASARTSGEPMVLTARLQAEAGWTGWAAETLLCSPPLLQAGAVARLSVPPLPRRVGASRVPIPPLTAFPRQSREPLASPRTRVLDPALDRPGVRRDLPLALGLPVSVQGEDIQRLSRALWMRYTLHLVRATGENIRNLEILGLYRIPAMGVLGVKHQPATGRLLLELGPEAAGVRRSPFILACRKSDRTVVSCFVEEG